MTTSDLPEGSFIDRDGNPTTGRLAAGVIVQGKPWYPPNTWPQRPLQAGAPVHWVGPEVSPQAREGDKITLVGSDWAHEGIVRKVHADGTMDIDWHIA